MKINENKIKIISFFLFITASIYSTGFYHWDEHFQILEFAALKLNLTNADSLPWEYHNLMRPSLQPLMVVALYKIMDFVDLGSPFIVSFLTRLISALLAYTAINLKYTLYKNSIKDELIRNIFLIVTFLLWFNPYLGVRFSSENWSGIFFSIGFSLFFILNSKNTITYMLIGVLFGVSFSCRYQAAFLIIGFLSWILFFKKAKIYEILCISFGVITMLFISVLMDFWFYEKLTFAPWNYFSQNIIEDKVSSFGISPWYFYVTSFLIKGIPPLSVFFVFSFVFFILYKIKDPITWSILPFLLIHLYIGHKELRFLFPIIYFLPIILAKSLEIMKQNKKNFLFKILKVKVLITLFAINLLALGISTIKFDNRVSLYEKLYENKKLKKLYYTPKVSGILTPFGVPLSFYKRDLQFKMTKNPESIQEKKFIFLNGQFERYKFKNRQDLIYKTLPDWAINFNFNKWIERTNPVSLYLIIK